MSTVQTWGGSLHLTFRLLPSVDSRLSVFLDSDGKTPEEVLAALPYDAARSASPGGGPDRRRYRDGKHLFQLLGLLYEDDSNHVRLSALGEATRRWLPLITSGNKRLLGRHAAYALAACQLRNPTGSGKRYAANVTVFPFAFMWRAMLQLDDVITSDELNRALFKVTDEESLCTAVKNIGAARAADDLDVMGPETIPGQAKNDRIIPWIASASFGWILIADKRDSTVPDHYQLFPDTRAVVKEASRMQYRHQEFPSVERYVEHIARCAALPDDLR